MTKIKVTVKYLGSFSQLTSKRAEVVELEEGANVGNLTSKLVGRYGRELKKRLEDASTRPVLFFIGDRAAGPREKLCDGDEVLISYPAGGG